MRTIIIHTCSPTDAVENLFRNKAVRATVEGFITKFEILSSGDYKLTIDGEMKKLDVCEACSISITK